MRTRGLALTSAFTFTLAFACTNEVPIGRGEPVGASGSSAEGGSSGSAGAGAGGIGGAGGASGSSTGGSAGNTGGAAGSASGGTGGVAPTSACAGLAAHLADSPWPTAGGCSSRQGRSRYSPAQNLSLEWSMDAAKLGYGWASGYVAPAIATDGTLYVGTVGVGNPAVVAAISSAGDPKWKFQVMQEVHFGWNTPTLGADGVVYVGSTNFGEIGAPWESALYALRPDGSQKWQFSDTGASVSHVAIGADGTLYYGAYGHVYAISEQGKLVWDVPTQYSTGTPSIGPDGTIYVGSYDEHLYAISPSGSVKWTFAAGREVDGTPLIGDDGTIYVTASYSKLYALQPDGGLKWEYTVTPEAPQNVGGGLGSLPALGTDGTLYIGHNMKLNAIDASGKLAWSLPEVPALSPPVIAANGDVLVTTTDHRVCEVSALGAVVTCIQVMPKDTQVAMLAASPVITAEGGLIVIAWGDRVYGYGPQM